MKQFLCFVIGFTMFVSGCSNEKTKCGDEVILVEYPVPFYLRTEGSKNKFLYGVKTKRFVYVELNEEPWLLFDKYVDSENNINMINTDGYTFIQLDLQRQLHELVEHQKNDYLKFETDLFQID